MAPMDFSTGNAKALVGEYLTQLGMYSLLDKAWDQWLKNPNEGEFMLWLRTTDEYKKQFPYAEDLRKKGIPFSEAEALSYSRNVRQTLRAIGAPDQLITKEYIDNLIANDVGWNEFQQTVTTNLQAYFEAPEIVKDEFRSQLGDDGAVMAFFLDRDFTTQKIREVGAAAFTRGYGREYGFDIDRDAAARFAYGRTADEIRQRVAQATEFDSLTRGTIDDPDAFSDTQLVETMFTGDTRRIAKELDERTADFADAGGPVMNQQRTGFGSAS